ncbi:MAG: N-acetyl-gamma-glutamyl-phosphate reductase [Spirochaetales bacterium]|nr:N-acetyl-gamma-glutamyl-phosphate reductase [Candidatus Physcosoma equi]
MQNFLYFYLTKRYNVTKVFIDGSAGTTGLRLHERLSLRPEIEFITLSEELRKDENARREALNASDISFLCLPDKAAMEAVALVTNPNVVVIDTSTAHRTNDNWTYGFPELPGQYEKVKGAKRVANPGCHASGFIALVAPLVKCGLIKKDAVLSAFSLTGYSGGGKKMIAEYEGEGRNPLLDAPRMYGLTQCHKHLPEMAKVCGLENAPLFSPIVASYLEGMEVVVQLPGSMLKGTIEDAKECYKATYQKGLVHFVEKNDEEGFLSASAFLGRDDMEVSIYGNSDRITLVSRFDNLGKGASGSAIENMNIILGLDEATGLNV